MRFDPPLFRAGCPVSSGRIDPPQQRYRRAAMYYIVEIRPNGTETFLKGFEEFSETWDVLSRLQCETQRQRL